MSKELEELVSFLHSPQPAVVQIALDNLKGFSQGPQQQLFAHDNYTPVKDLKRLTRDQLRSVVTHAVTILVNLCDDKYMRDLMVDDHEFVEFIARSILDIKNTNADLMCILLANMAKSDGIIKILNVKFEYNEEEAKLFKSVNAIDSLMDCFVKGYDRSLNIYANFDYLSFFFADISRYSSGREYFVTKQEYDHVVPLSKLLVFTEKYDSKIRREGIASTIKNSLFDIEKQYTLIIDDDINLLPYILLPLAGPEELSEDEMFNLPEELQLLPSDKQRDPVTQIICTHLESILLLCSTKKSREILREKSVYPLIRELHKATDVEEVAVLCDRVVQMLMRDEAPEEDAGYYSEEEDQIIEVI